MNPSVFRPFVVDHYRLAARFDPIVISREEGTDDKVRLCEIALHRLGFAPRRASALLIDNLERHVVAWRSRGGLAYHFRGEAEFNQDLDKWPLSVLAG